MMPPASHKELGHFRANIDRHLGLFFEDAKLGFLSEVIARRAEANGSDYDVYLASLADPGTFQSELPSLAVELTVPETYFLRHGEQLQAFVEEALPQRMKVKSPCERLQVLSAGCASGEEAYSLAILARERLDAAAGMLQIRGVDINAGVLKKARLGRYTPWSLRDTPPRLQSRYFTREGRDFILRPGLRDAVDFERRNLTVEDPELWIPAFYDVVFCRNVLIYFSQEQAQALVSRIARSLQPGGYLFLGSAENLRGLSQDFHLRHSHEAFYYQLKDPAERQAGPGLVEPVPASSPCLHFPAQPALADSWMETIQNASERIRHLAEPEPSVPARPDEPTWDLETALALLGKERYRDALDTMKDLPAGSAQDPDVLLLKAVLFSNSGQHERAEAMCRALLQIDDSNAEAHYVCALCREGAEDPAGAMEHDRISAYLDPGFAMPRLHLGRLARRQRDGATAQRELTRAAELLQREEASRLLLFGGGFSRAALAALCRAELEAVRNVP